MFCWKWKPSRSMAMLKCSSLWGSRASCLGGPDGFGKCINVVLPRGGQQSSPCGQQPWPDHQSSWAMGILRPHPGLLSESQGQGPGFEYEQSLQVFLWAEVWGAPANKTPFLTNWNYTPFCKTSHNSLLMRFLFRVWASPAFKVIQFCPWLRNILCRFWRHIPKHQNRRREILILHHLLLLQEQEAPGPAQFITQKLILKRKLSELWH